MIGLQNYRLIANLIYLMKKPVNKSDDPDIPDERATEALVPSLVLDVGFANINSELEF